MKLQDPKGGWFKGEGTRKPWGTLGKVREYTGTMAVTRLPTPFGPPPLKDILMKVACSRIWMRAKPFCCAGGVK